MLCYGEDMFGGRRFGAGGPRVRRYSWEAPDMVNQEIEWARRPILSPSGMLAESWATMEGYEDGVWPHGTSFVSEACSVVVSSADYELRMARALELIEPGIPTLAPRHERTLSYWFRGNALLLAGVTWGAYLSSGVNWALLNGMLTPSSEMTTSLKALVPLVTNQRVINCADVKRKLYLRGTVWPRYADTRCSLYRRIFRVALVDPDHSLPAGGVWIY
ncbi:hypothetical protein MRX96_052740 [Rhipicephalus microplus]